MTRSLLEEALSIHIGKEHYIERIREDLCNQFPNRRDKHPPLFIGEGNQFISTESVQQYIADNPLSPNNTIRKSYLALKQSRIIPVAYHSGFRSFLLGACFEESDCTLIDPETYSVRLAESASMAQNVTNSLVDILLINANTFTQFEEYYHDPELAKRELDGLLEKRGVVVINEDELARKTFTSYLRHAIRRRASDIHFEPLPSNSPDSQAYQIRFRVDGALQHMAPIKSGKRGSSIIQVLKADAEMDISEHRKPQDGKINLDGHKNYPDKEFKDYQLRISTVSPVEGESAVIRILKRNPELLDLETLGFPYRMAETITNLTNSPQGLFVVTGPTGSGKTTTLYSILNKLNVPDVKIVTIEDPVEISLRGLTQCEVRKGTNMTFANACRTFLRQDPDIILVGETRDEETTAASVEAAKTGHFVLTTVHTTGAIQTLNRLYDKGADPADLQDNLVGVLAQRLVRKVCQECAIPVSGRNDLEKIFGIDDLEGDVTLMRPSPRGEQRKTECQACAGTGYYGRIVVPELWVMGDGERELIGKGKFAQADFLKVAMDGGMIPISGAGMNLVLDGKTSLKEYLGNVMQIHECRNRKEYLLDLIRKHPKFEKN